MDAQIKRSPLPGVNQRAGSSKPNAAQHNAKSHRVKPGTKEYMILAALVAGKSLNRFDAIKLHDTALNSTISTLQGKGLQIHRERETVPCVNHTKKVDVMRYRLLPDQIERAKNLMGVGS